MMDTKSNLLSPYVNLPWFVLLDASALCAHGLYSALSPQSPGKPGTSMLGICELAIGLNYFLSSYMPPNKNQYLAAGVPIRLILSAIATIKLPYAGKEEKGTLMFTAVLDAVGAIALGWWLGRWDGRVTIT